LGIIALGAVVFCTVIRDESSFAIDMARTDTPATRMDVELTPVKIRDNDLIWVQAEGVHE
jgi:hypothetical protein